ncbi:MAG: hypothetical protein KGL39_23145 [Patescibacteria group bacterium]|nr:hypothetical protein [Patescibacteria group bacterium]
MNGRTERHIVAENGVLGQLSVYFESYRAQRYLHIRYWFKHKETGEWTPGVKGIGVPGRDVPALMEAIRKAIADEPHEEQPEAGLAEEDGQAGGADDSAGESDSFDIFGGIGT